MKKLILSAWLLVLSMVATAQSFVIVDKQGNKTTYDVSKLDSVTFQQNPPSFTVYEETEPEPSQGGETPAKPKQEPTTCTFDEVQSVTGDPKFLFAHPDTVYVGADGQTFAFQLRSNVAYDYTPSDRWLSFGHASNDTDSLYFAAAMNPNTQQRLGYIAFVNKDDAAMRDTIYVVQYAKRDSRYIDINWERTTIESYNRETGRAVLVFQDPIPVMGDHDVTLLPGNQTYEIRIIDDVQQLSDTKVQIDTREGKMGNLFKDQQFTLCSDPNYDPSSESGSSGGGTKPSKAPAVSGPVYYPETIELLQNGKPIAEVYNRAMRRDSKLEKEFNIFEYNYDNSGAVIWEKGAHSVSWQECKFDVGLKGIFAFDFGDVEWENVRFGDLKNFKAYLDGDFNTDLILKYTLTKGVEASVEKTLAKDIFSYRVKFMVGTIPVWINLSSDLMASVEAKAEAQVSVSGGVRAHANLKGGVEWDTNRGVNPISSFDYQYEVVKPEVEAEAHAEAKAYVWPQINIGIYDVLCPTINPKPYVRAYADARTAEANKPFFGWNAGVSAGIDLTLGLSLQLWKWKKEIAEIDPVNLIDYDLVAVPTMIEIDDAEHLTRNVMKGDTCHVKYRVKGINHITGSEYNIPLACVKIEKNGGGEIDSEQWKGADYFYTNRNGEIDVVYTQTDETPATLKATLITGDEERDKEAKEWRTVYYDYRLTAPDADEPEHSVQATRAGKADVKYQVEEFVKYNAEDEGQWRTKTGVAVVFNPSNGKMEADTIRTSNNGIAIGKFDGGEGFEGGSVAVKAIIEEFDTIYVDKLTINKFSFDDPKLAKAYNLKDNTVLACGEELDVTSKALGLNLQYPTYGHFRFTAEKEYGGNGPVIRETESHESHDYLGRVSTDRRVVESVKNRQFQVDNASFKTENIESISHEENLGFCYMTDYVWTKETIKVTCLNEPELGSTILSYYFNKVYYPTFVKVGDIKEYFNEGVPISGTSSLSYNFEGGYDGWDDGDGTKWNDHPINGKICEFKEKDKYVVIFYIIRDDNKDAYAKIVFDEGEEMKYFGY